MPYPPFPRPSARSVAARATAGPPSPGSSAVRGGPTASLAARRVVLAGLLAVAALVAWPTPTAAEVVRIEILSRTPVLDGRPFGDVGAYEKIVGRVHFAFDPDDPANARIVDLEHAPVGEDGRVRATANFMVLRPRDPARGSGVALLEVSNRGGKAVLGYLNDGTFARDPSAPEDFGDGLLMRLGVTVIWVGWQTDISPEEEDALRLEVPTARQADGTPIRGLVRADRVVDEATTTWDLGHRGHVAYAVSDTLAPEVLLTVRDGREAPRRELPPAAWSWARPTEDGRVMPSRTHVHLPGGFRPGAVYELVYPAEGPRVAGLGLAAIRDMMSYARHDPDSPFPVDRGFALGISQTGRFLRHFLYQGFNVDEAGRKVFDGMMIHTAGAGRGSFNHRFAQASRDAHRFSAFFYPTDLFPFTGRAQHDSVSGRRDGLLALYGAEGDEAAASDAPGACPAGPRPEGLREPELRPGRAAMEPADGARRYAPGAKGADTAEARGGLDRDPCDLPMVFATNTGYEYWGRAASLLHTSPGGGADVEPLPAVRIYHLASAQHFVDAFPPLSGRRLTGPEQPPAWRGNPLDFLVNLRALASRMVDYLTRGTPPPPARHPRVDRGTLLTRAEAAVGFLDLPGLAFPGVVHVAYRADYGPRWDEGIVSRQPPELGPAFPSLVPAIDRFGNERGGVRNVAVRAPLATYTPWSARTGLPGPEAELADFRGAFAPLPADSAAAARTGDPRPTLEALYGSKAAYLERARSEARALVDEGFLLEEDVDRVLERAARTWDWIAAGAEARAPEGD